MPSVCVGQRNSYGWKEIPLVQHAWLCYSNNQIGLWVWINFNSLWQSYSQPLQWSFTKKKEKKGKAENCNSRRLKKKKVIIKSHVFQGPLLWRSLPVLGDNDEVPPIPVNNQLLSLEGKAGAPFIWLIEVHTFISCYDELQILWGVTERRTAQSTTVSVQLQMRIVFHWKQVRLQRKHKVLELTWTRLSSQ